MTTVINGAGEQPVAASARYHVLFRHTRRSGRHVQAFGLLSAGAASTLDDELAKLYALHAEFVTDDAENYPLVNVVATRSNSEGESRRTKYRRV